MFKVLVIDDEPTIRKGLINIINWKKYQCEICGEAGDGVEGLEKIKTYEPDIIFADINMPEIDGLEMIKEGKRMIPYCKFIILSGYREFSYMQEAIKLGAFDYILKPSSIEDICEVVQRAVIELKYQSDHQLEINKLRKCFEESIPILKEKLLYDVIFKININEDEIREGFNLYGINIDEFIMIIIDMDNDTKKREPYQRQLYQFGIINTVSEMFTEYYEVEKVVLSNYQIAFIIGTKNTDELQEESIYKKVHNIKQLIESCFDFTISIAISTKGYHFTDLHRKLQECKSALSYRFYMGNSSIILYGDLKDFYQDQDHMTFDNIDKELCTVIKAGNEEDVKAILEQIGTKVIQTNLEPEYIKVFYWNLIYEINMIRLSIKNLDTQDRNMIYDISTLYRRIEHATQVKELQALLEEFALNIVHRINRYNKKNINQILQSAIDYIYENYNMSITLNELAEHSYVSTYYLSRMFKKELGKNFVEYLNEIRIAKAKELLKGNKYKTYEVAELVGIQDPHYFSKIFKKYMNMTPTEYKDSTLS